MVNVVQSDHSVCLGMEKVADSVCIACTPKLCRSACMCQEKGVTIRSKLVPVVPQLVPIQVIEKDQLH